MKNIILKVVIALVILLCAYACTSCEHTDIKNPSTKDDDTTIRTTITEDEWNEIKQMDNYTATIELPDYTYTVKVSENAIQDSRVSGSEQQNFYYVNDAGLFYTVYDIDGIWYRNSEPLTVTSMIKYYCSDFKFEDLIYDQNNKTYVGYINVDGEEIYRTYSFENGILVKVKDSLPDQDFEVFFTDVETTNVNVPEYIEISTYYAFEVMPNGGSFERVDITSYSLPSSIKEVHRAINGGYVFIVEFNGYNTENVAIIGVDDSGVIVGTKFIQGHDYMELFKTGYYNGVDLGTIDNVDIVSGCTISSTVYRAVIKDVLEVEKILSYQK